MIKALRLLTLGLLFALVQCLSGNAAVLVHLTLDEMTDQSSAILLGRCVQVESTWNAAHTDIVTNNIFEVQEYYKGNLGRRVTITELGGQVDTWVAEYTGLPRFAVGEEAVLFVWTDPHGGHQVLGLTQGKFAVQRDKSTGNLSVAQTASHEPTIEPSSHAGEGPPERLTFALGTFKNRVYTQLKKPTGSARQ